MTNSLDRLCDEISSLSLVDAAKLVSLLEEKLGIPVGSFAVGPAQSGSGADEQGGGDAISKMHKVVLVDFEASKKLSLIKIIRSSNPDMSLKDAKELLDKDSSSRIINAEPLSTEQAEALKKSLIDAGAKEVKFE